MTREEFYHLIDTLQFIDDTDCDPPGCQGLYTEDFETVVAYRHGNGEEWISKIPGLEVIGGTCEAAQLVFKYDPKAAQQRH
jgi:hypothetical protein